MSTVPANRRLISIVIPILNEAAGIAQLRGRLAQLEQVFQDTAETEFVFVDDGSADETGDRLRSVFGSRPDCRIVAHDRNRGVGAAFRTGFAHATGSLVCTIDADCSYEPKGLKRLIEALDRTGADIAVASPYHPQGTVENIVPWRIFMSQVCSGIYRLISPVALYTYTSIFRAYRRPVIETVQFDADGFVSAAEILIRAAEQGYRIAEVPMTLRGRKIGYTKMKVLSTIRAHLRMMGGTVLRRFAGRGRSGAGQGQGAYDAARSSLVAGQVRSAGSTIPGLSRKE